MKNLRKSQSFCIPFLITFCLLQRSLGHDSSCQNTTSCYCETMNDCPVNQKCYSSNCKCISSYFMARDDHQTCMINPAAIVIWTLTAVPIVVSAVYSMQCTVRAFEKCGKFPFSGQATTTFWVNGVALVTSEMVLGRAFSAFLVYFRKVADLKSMIPYTTVISSIFLSTFILLAGLNMAFLFIEWASHGIRLGLVNVDKNRPTLALVSVAFVVVATLLGVLLDPSAVLIFFTVAIFLGMGFLQAASWSLIRSLRGKYSEETPGRLSSEPVIMEEPAAGDISSFFSRCMSCMPAGTRKLDDQVVPVPGCLTLVNLLKARCAPKRPQPQVQAVTVRPRLRAPAGKEADQSNASPAPPPPPRPPPPPLSDVVTSGSPHCRRTRTLLSAPAHGLVVNCSSTASYSSRYGVNRCSNRSSSSSSWRRASDSSPSLLHMATGIRAQSLSMRSTSMRSSTLDFANRIEAWVKLMQVGILVLLGLVISMGILESASSATADFVVGILEIPMFLIINGLAVVTLEFLRKRTPKLHHLLPLAPLYPIASKVYFYCARFVCNKTRMQTIQKNRSQATVYVVGTNQTVHG